MNNSMLEFNESYFGLLPDEVLIHILSYIDTSDLLHFTGAYSCDYFFRERRVIRSVNLSRNYALRDLKPITSKIAPELVTVLNINCLYWIPVTDLRRFLLKLVNLEHLYAISTRLDLTNKDLELYNSLKITRLVVTVTTQFENIAPHLKVPSVTAVYLDLNDVFKNFGPFVALFPNVQKFWIDIDTLLYPPSVQASDSDKSKIFLKISFYMPQLEYDLFGYTIYFAAKRLCQPAILCVEKLRNVHPHPDFLSRDPAWGVLTSLRYTIPYGPRDARKLWTNEVAFDQIYFEELSFHNFNFELNDSRFSAACINILRSENARKLKKLCMMLSILFTLKEKPKPESEDDGGIFEEFFLSFPLLTHLELYATKGMASNASAFSAIKVLNNLTYLSVEIPLGIDGSFLVEVCQNCPLKTLKINSDHLNDNLNYNMAKSIPHLTELRDLRFENYQIKIDKIMTSLLKLQSGKLQRVALVCKETEDKFSQRLLEDFLVFNSQLVFFYLLIIRATQKLHSAVQKVLWRHRKTHPARQFFVVRERGKLIQIADVHYNEMVMMSSRVSTVYAYDDFINF